MSKQGRAVFHFGIGLVALALLAACGGGGAVDHAPPQPADTTAPVITEISGISNGDVIKSSAVFGASATDETGVTRFKLAINEATVVDTTWEHIDYSWDVRGEAEGAYALVFTAFDAAENSASQTINVYVGDSWPVEVEEEEEETPPGMQLTAELVSGEDYALPPMDPALLNPNDQEVPKLIISGISNEEVVYGTRIFSVLASDDTGVNVITLLIDGKQVALERDASMQYAWDTTFYSDGYHLLTLIVRDNGGKVGRCELHTTVDNATEHDPPVLVLTGFDNRYVTGVHHVEVQANDASGIASLRLEFRHWEYGLEDNEGPMTFELTSDTGQISYDWDTTQYATDSTFAVYADVVDKAGNRLWERLAWLGTVNYYTVTASICKPNGLELGGVLACLVPADFAGDYTELPNSACVKTAYTSRTHYGNNLYLADVPFGDYKLYFIRDQYVEILEANCPPVVEGGPRLELETIEFTLQYHVDYSYGDIRKLAVVWGADDRIDDMFAALTESRYLNLSLGTRKAYDGADVLSGDELAFAEILEKEAAWGLLYQGAQILVIDSGVTCEEAILADPELSQALKHWVQDGGNLIVIGRSYDFVEQLWPEKIDFAGDDGIDGMGSMPEQLDAAQVGTASASDQLCLFKRVAHPEWEMQNYFGRYVDYWLKYYFPYRYEDCTYDEANDTFTLPVHGFAAGWPVVEQVAADVSVWMTLAAEGPGGVAKGTPVQLGFMDGLGEVILVTHLMCAGDPAYAPQAYCVFNQFERD
ncbi:hypothetical protein JW859_05690 [bacterium]|nr:hypothetical protein [bacterium]